MKNKINYFKFISQFLFEVKLIIIVYYNYPIFIKSVVYTLIII